MQIYLIFKRIFDIVLSLIAVIILSPLLLAISLAILFDSEGGILFKQRRIGAKKKHFDILKFRTMRTDTPKDVPTHLLQDPFAYITRTGRFLRKTSMDELPQIINILKGEMSFVGPRPALWNQLDLVEDRDKYGANDIRPGLTGWAQINGRDDLPIEKKAKFDGEYVKRMSFIFDIKILLVTFFNALKSEGFKEGMN